MEELILELEQDNTQNYGFYAFNILKTKAMELFKNDKALCCLAKSDSFLKELLKLYNKLYFFEIIPNQLEKIINLPNISTTDKNRLEICIKLYDTYLETMSQNSYSIPVYNEKVFDKTISEEILEQKIKDFDKYECIEFSDVQKECDFVAQEIQNLVNNNVAQYNDIAIFADKSQMRQKILDILKTSKIPVISNIYDENYENLKYKITLYHQMSAILTSLKVVEFSSEGLKNIDIDSKAKKEIKLEEFDELIKIILLETIKNNNNLDKIFFKKEISQKTLLEVLFSNISNFSEEDKEAINKEFGLFKHFYELYKQNNYFEAIKLLINSQIANFANAEIKKTILKKTKSLEQLQKLYEEILQTTPDFEAFLDILQWLGKDKTNEGNAITLESIESKITHKKHFKHIFVLGLTENNFPGTNSAYPFISEQTNIILSEKIKELAPDFGLLVNTDEIFYTQKLSNIKDVINSAIEKLTLTTHTYEAKKQVQPSSVFKIASKNKNKFKKILKQHQNRINDENSIYQTTITDKNTIIKESTILKLSASSINTFNNCPRKYFYKHLLNLKEPYTFSASYGSIVHAVFEVLNRKFLEHNKFTKEITLELGEILFNSKENPDKALNVGFKQTDIDLVDVADDLSLAEMKNNFIDAIEDFSMSGGFDNPPKSAVCEKSFSFEIPDIPNVIFEGRIDAILEDKNGKYCVIDYKTGHDKINSLDYAISDNGVNFLLKTGKEPANKETLQKNFDYQIPIYYLACQNSENLSQFKDKISELGLVYIRPKSKDNGCSEDIINSDRLGSYKDKIIQNLKETIVDKIKNETDFKQNRSFLCDNCAYKFLCDAEDCDE